MNRHDWWRRHRAQVLTSSSDPRSWNALDCVALIRSWGTTEELSDLRDTAGAFFTALTNSMKDPELGGYLRPFEAFEDGYIFSPDKAVNLHDTVADYLDALALIIETVEAAEKRLEEHGFEFDTETRRAKSIPGPRGGRPRHLLTDEVGRVWEVLRPNFRKNTGQTEMNSGALRECIRDALSLYFPPELLDASPGGSIDSAVEGYLQRRRRSRA